MTEYQAKFQEYQSIEMTLRNQVALYNNKYEEFEKSLTRSNKMFGGFKEEMESVSILRFVLICCMMHECKFWSMVNCPATGKENCIDSWSTVFVID